MYTAKRFFSRENWNIALTRKNFFFSWDAKEIAYILLPYSSIPEKYGPWTYVFFSEV